jgi:hypothetical protein
MNIHKRLQREQRLLKRTDDMKGTGSFIFVNCTKGDFYLPRPTKSGKRIVKFGEEFEGDSYYMFLLKTGELRIVREVQDETKLLKETSMSEKLLTEQPPTVTHDGKVEYVVTEEDNEKKKKDKLLSEKSLEGVKLLLE